MSRRAGLRLDCLLGAGRNRPVNLGRSATMRLLALSRRRMPMRSSDRLGIGPQPARRRPVLALHVRENDVDGTGLAAERVAGHARDCFDELALLLDGSAFEQFDVECGHRVSPEWWVGWISGIDWKRRRQSR